ncbi:MAG TPA: thioredoxin, partial [Armatimonadota bacterium]|nr:thioredoxin [Armatimonadota bacterium]
SEFDQEVLKHEGTVLVDFFAVWCPPCRALAPLLERFSEENADRVKIVKVDSDQDEALAAEYGIRTIPTLIAFKEGREVTRAVNPQSRAALEALISQ